MSGLRVLVTGAAGFLGSALAAELLARGNRVVGLDVSWDLGRLPEHPHMERHTGDVRDEALLRRLMAGCDRALHMAAVAGVHDYMSRPFEVLDVNILGTRAALLAAHAARVPILIASSSEAYGKNPLPLHPGASSWLGPTTHARWCYATSKVAGEHFAWALVKQ
ncbi:MAG TPA: NAD-dependent epimerase/dehydratase family protein, partial [Myxococcota bacterium]|nr:NAD-dependent epimerase/dehydratase family protein [Myxococcota bacterium]